MSAKIDQAIAALATTREALATALIAILGRYGTFSANTAEHYPAAQVGDIAVGDLVAVLARGKYRAARVWSVGRTNLSAVYVTEREADGVERFGWIATPSNVTAKIADCHIVEHVGEGEVAQVEAPAAPAVEQRAGGDALTAGMLPVEVEGFLF